jgi:hypothetical protein
LNVSQDQTIFEQRFEKMNLTGAGEVCCLCGNSIEVLGIRDCSDGHYYCLGCGEVVRRHYEKPIVERFKAQFAEKIEEVAKENAAEIGFDYENEAYGLARAICIVLSSKELMAEAIRRAKEVSEESGSSVDN